MNSQSRNHFDNNWANRFCLNILSKLSLFFLASLAFSGESLFAQSEVATLTGVVTDASGGVLTNVEVTVTNTGTNLSKGAATNETGRYFLPGLKPGVYSVTASFSGFKEQVNSAVTLQVNQTARLDISLAVGEISQELTVSAEAPLLETERSSRGAVVDSRKMVELPLNGRDYKPACAPLLGLRILAPSAVDFDLPPF